MMRYVLLLVTLTALFGCGDQIQFVDPPGLKKGPATRGHERIDPHGTAGGNPQGTEDPFADEGDAGSGVVDQGRRVDADKVFFAGTIKVDPGIQLPNTYKVYVMAGTKPQGNDPKTGQPKRMQPMFVTVYNKPTFPLSFTLTGANMFGADTAVDEPLALGYILSERGTVDSSGGGLFLRKMFVDTLHAPGTKDVQITITR